MSWLASFERELSKSEACDRSGYNSRNVTSAEEADCVVSIGSGNVMVGSWWVVFVGRALVTGFGGVNLMVALGISTVMLGWWLCFL